MLARSGLVGKKSSWPNFMPFQCNFSMGRTNKKHTQTDGSIDFINGNKMLLNECIFNHQPKVGDMILFPHYLMHTAYPFKTKGERRSFSFNLEIDRKIANVFSK